jgi:hypothetical protein
MAPCRIFYSPPTQLILLNFIAKKMVSLSRLSSADGGLAVVVVTPGPRDQLIMRPLSLLLRCNNIRLVEGPRSGPSRVSKSHGELAMRITLAVVITALSVLFVTLAARATIGPYDYPVQAEGLPLVY